MVTQQRGLATTIMTTATITAQISAARCPPNTAHLHASAAVLFPKSTEPPVLEDSPRNTEHQAPEVYHKNTESLQLEAYPQSTGHQVSETALQKNTGLPARVVFRRPMVPQARDLKISLTVFPKNTERLV